jgi:hypothetical protein
MSWDSFKGSVRDSDRTDDLCDKLTLWVNTNIGANRDLLSDRSVVFRNADLINVKNSINYLKNHPSMLTYDFDDYSKLNRLKIGPETLTLLEKSRERQCAHSVILHKLLSGYVTGLTPPITVKHNAGYIPKCGENMTQTNEDKVVRAALAIVNGLNSGGYKSRRKNRKPARKTRRAHGRGRGRRTK